ncbi:NUDIX hydrolase [Streptococcus equi]|uniref:NUDIX hydrolase n=1 Tax=Streptococcus equi subsp. equi (strain 4047) TaxID=553482 RepID=C0M9U7_STRE4|nr:NUDIX hydrolase [Streptococcus equi]ASB97693.1 DNA mismatch repair protein MutT [Streptococcus equi subsp. equi]MBT1194424.1 NUDIX hydrolase [Streptococcus equi subsp. equi]MBT1197254.1 NUDIX hydrolase [Streptococcus equi subsp. equi]MBT1199945.1 NUDIX hydrolase [Streptococcus equi subsp. equi]MBT1202044.1 NUDIX hydrolase [Streptococcus equi subsp. equi]
MKLLDKTVHFSGAKLALISNGKILTILRDAIPTIPYPNMWDLPGGGRENAEAPFDCASRECYEELGLALTKDAVVWERVYPGLVNPDSQSVFLVALMNQDMIDHIAFGDEGQGYQLMAIDDFLADDRVIPQLKARLADYLRK